MKNPADKFWTSTETGLGVATGACCQCATDEQQQRAHGREIHGLTLLARRCRSDRRSPIVFGEPIRNGSVPGPGMRAVDRQTRTIPTTIGIRGPAESRMRNVILLSVFTVSVVFGGPIGVGPVPVSGSGNAFFSLDESVVSESFFGTDGTDSVSLMNGMGVIGPYAGVGFGDANGNNLFSGEACVEDGSSDTCSQYFDFDLGANGSLTLFSQTGGGTVIASATLTGWISATDFSYENPACLPEGCQETFAISPTPEPGTASMVLLGTVIAVCHKRRFGKSSLPDEPRP